MSKSINTVATERKPTEQQAMLIAMAKRGTTRAKVRAALQYEDGAPIPVQTMLKKLERFGYRLTSEIGDDRAATYRLTAVQAKAPKAKAKAKRAA